MKITRKESKQKFYDMYMWLAEHPWAEKQDYFKAHPEIERPCDDCFPCQYENEPCYTCKTFSWSWPGDYYFGNKRWICGKCHPAPEQEIY